jgi:hypothetical protein
MSFLNPGFLWLLPLIGLPLLIHLLGRRRFQVVNFSTLRFLKSLQTDILRRLKIRQIILLIIRTLLILGLILLFARPYRSGSAPGIFVNKGATLYLIADNSASMSLIRQGQTRLESGLESIISSARNIDFPVNLKIISTAQTPAIFRSSNPNGPADLQRELSLIENTNYNGQILPALEIAVEDIIQNNDPTGVIWAVSDFQRSSWGDDHSADLILKKIRDNKIRLVLFPVNGVNDNAALGGLNFIEEIHTKNKPLTLQVGLNNWRSRPAEIPVALFIEGERVGQALTKTKPVQTAPVMFEFIPLNTGYLSGYLQLEEDDLAADNRRYFVLNIPANLKILIVGEQATDGDYILKALQAEPDLTVDTRFITREYFGNENLPDYNGLIFSNVKTLSVSAQKILSDYLNRGGGMLLFACRNCLPKDFNALWADRFGLPRWHATRRATDETYLSIGRCETDHPVFRNLWPNNAVPDGSARFYIIPGLVCGAHQKTLMTFDDGTPLMIEPQRTAGRIIMLATAPDGAWTDLPFSGLFPVLLQRLMLYIAGGAAQPSDYPAGDLVEIVKIPGENTLPQILTPSGRRFNPQAGEGGFRFSETSETGIYTIIRDEQRLERFAVNIPECETNGEFFTETDYKALIKANPVNIAVVTEIKDDEINQLALTREFSTPLLIAVLVLAAAETFLGRLNRTESGDHTNT